MKRCDLCGLPMRDEGASGYCSPRCLAWDFFGVPALKREAMVKEIQANQQRLTAPDDWERQMPYDFDPVWRRAITSAIYLIYQTQKDDE